MKKNIFLFFALLLSLSVMGQKDNKVPEDQNNSYVPFIKFKGDTLSYLLHNFYHNEQKYIGKDLNTLLGDIEIPIKSYKMYDPDVQWSYGSYSAFFFNSIPHKESFMIIIYWAKALQIDCINKLWLKSKGIWTEDVREYYGKQIIKYVGPGKSRY